MLVRVSEDQLAEIRNKKIGFVFQQFNLFPKPQFYRMSVSP